MNSDVVVSMGYRQEELGFLAHPERGQGLILLQSGWKNRQQISVPLKLSCDLKHFMGYRFALFNVATETAGGYMALVPCIHTSYHSAFDNHATSRGWPSIAEDFDGSRSSANPMQFHILRF